MAKQPRSPILEGSGSLPYTSGQSGLEMQISKSQAQTCTAPNLAGPTSSTASISKTPHEARKPMHNTSLSLLSSFN